MRLVISAKAGVLGLLLPILQARSVSSFTGEETTCREIGALTRMLRARSIEALSAERKIAGDGYRIELVFAFRGFELRPRDNSLAGALLGLLPQDEYQESVLLTLGDKLCDDESQSQMRALAGVRDELPRMFSRAVILVPGRLRAYVEYSLVASRDPHSDYAIQMQKVCRKLRPQLDGVIKALPAAQGEWLTAHVLDPRSCRALALPGL